MNMKNKLNSNDKIRVFKNAEIGAFEKIEAYDIAKKKKSQLKSNSGISLLSLIITIILIVIIAAIAIINGFSKNLDEAQFSKIYNEFLEVELAVEQRGYEHKLDATVYPYENSMAYTSTNTITVNNITYGDGYYLVTPDDFERLGVEGVVREYVVNYATGDVTLKEPYYLQDKEVYTKEDMLSIYTENSVITDAEYDEKKGVNKPVLTDGMLPVKWDGSNWIVIDSDSDEWYDYSLDSAGGPLRYANVMLMDDTTVEDSSGRQYSNEKLRGMNLENIAGMKVVTEGSMFVWIPRYTYKEETDGTKTIVYSKLTQDYTSNGYVKNPAFYYGEYTGAESTDKGNTGYIAGGKELTGIWISKYEAGYIS